jgi:hypothetical protein
VNRYSVTALFVGAVIVIVLWLVREIRLDVEEHQDYDAGAPLKGERLPPKVDL